MKPAIEMAVRWRDGITQDLIRIAAQPITPESEKELMALIRVRNAFLDRGGYGNFVLAVAITGAIDVVLMTRLYEDTKDLAAVRRLVVANGVGPKRLLRNLRRVLLLELPEDQVFSLPENFQALKPYEAWEAVMRHYVRDARMGKSLSIFWETEKVNWRVEPRKPFRFLGECFRVRSPFSLYWWWSAMVLDIQGDIHVLLQVCEKQKKPLKAIGRDQLRREIPGLLAGGGNPPYRLLTFSPNKPKRVAETVYGMKDRKQDAIRTQGFISGYFRDIEPPPTEDPVLPAGADNVTESGGVDPVTGDQAKPKKKLFVLRKNTAALITDWPAPQKLIQVECESRPTMESEGGLGTIAIPPTYCGRLQSPGYCNSPLG